jgi:hypothetical protein
MYVLRCYNLVSKTSDETIGAGQQYRGRTPDFESEKACSVGNELLSGSSARYLIWSWIVQPEIVQLVHKTGVKGSWGDTAERKVRVETLCSI